MVHNAGTISNRKNKNNSQESWNDEEQGAINDEKQGAIKSYIW